VIELFSFRLSKELLRELRSMATLEGCSASELVRRWVVEGVAAMKLFKDPPSVNHLSPIVAPRKETKRNRAEAEELARMLLENPVLIRPNIRGKLTKPAEMRMEWAHRIARMMTTTKDVLGSGGETFADHWASWRLGCKPTAQYFRSEVSAMRRLWERLGEREPRELHRIVALANANGWSGMEKWAASQVSMAPLAPKFDPRVSRATAEDWT
jgi:hypothetical protein